MFLEFFLMGKKNSLFVIYSLLGWALVGSPISWGQEENSVQIKCSLTTYPNLCTKTLLGAGLENVADGMLFALVQKTRDETKLLTPNLSSLSTNKPERVEAQNDSHVILDYCSELMNMSLKRLDQSLQALKESPTKHKRDIQTWLSAVLTFQHTCKDSINGLSRTPIGEMSSKVDYLSQLASNSLALVNAIPGNLKSRTTRRGLLSAEKFFPKWLSSKDRKLLQTIAVEANAVVAKDGSGNFETVSEAIKASPGGRFVIYVKSGTYKEKININKDDIMLIGDGKDSTIIYNDHSVASGSSMPDSATLVITGDRFIARDIGFQNTAGPKGEQALALNIASDRSVLYKCSIVGYQDTLYALAFRQFYRACDIYGTIDFIFGNALAVFQNCNIVLRRPLSGGYNVILAHGREDPGQNTGFSLQRCNIMADSDLSPVKHSIESYLGRPWKKYSRSVIMQSTIDDFIKPRGWIEWSGSFALNTLYFAEYRNSGPGSGTSDRVQWPGYHQIGPEEAMKFTVDEFIGGTAWLPSTGVAFDLGLD